MDDHIIHELLTLQMDGIRKYIDQQDHQSVRKAMNALAAYLMSRGLKPPSALNQWFEWLARPVGTWVDSSHEDLFNLAEPVFDRRIKDISFAAFCFSQRFGSTDDYQTRPVLQVRDHCKQHHSEEGYVRFRSILTQSKFAVLDQEDYVRLISDEKDLIIREQLMKCYERIDDWREYRKCPRCGWTLHFERGEWRCGTYNACWKVSKHGFIHPKAFRFKKGSRVYRLKPGIHRSVLVPGLPEQRIYEKVRKTYPQAELYPNFDHDGDIRVDLGGCRVLFDVKSYLSPHGLAKHLELSKNGENVQVIVIPSEYEVEGGPLYVKRLKSRLSGRKDLQIISERKIIRYLKEKERREQIQCV
ncbi:hypothetical protein [Staphylospora marina]|uniref:restriction endonuclease-related protein n=1 Tax=Staphylospora marina TaxID=2490858 RepID=UPI000F5B8E5E|nr:hypothetical protein [Staphylospora marina]